MTNSWIVERFSISGHAESILSRYMILNSGHLSGYTPRDLYNLGIGINDLYGLRAHLERSLGVDQTKAFGWTRAAIKELETHSPAKRISRSVRV